MAGFDAHSSHTSGGIESESYPGLTDRCQQHHHQDLPILQFSRKGLMFIMADIVNSIQSTQQGFSWVQQVAQGRGKENDPQWPTS